MSGESFVPTVGSISNRALIGKMEQWGWKSKKVSGETTLMVAPNGTKIEVRSAHIKQGNSKQTFDELTKAMGMPWADFIRPLNEDELVALKLFKALSIEEIAMVWDAWDLQDMTNAARVKEQQRAEQLRLRDERRANQKIERDRRRNQQHTTPPAAIEEKTVEKPEKPDIVPEVSAIKKRARGAVNRVLDALVSCDEPMSVNRLAEMLPDIPRSTITGACLSLTETHNVAYRVKPGVYRLRDEARRGSDYRVGIDITASGAPNAAEVSRAPDEVQAKIERAVQKPDGWGGWAPEPTAVAPVAPDDETLNETLDLLFPEGFKARHLPMIDEWRRATIALMREIRHG